MKYLTKIVCLIALFTLSLSLSSCKKNTEPVNADTPTPSQSSEPAEEVILEQEGDLEITVPEDEETFGE